MIPELTNIASSDPAKPNAKEIAAKVQSMFMEVMLKAMEESVDAEDGLFGNSASSDIYRGMLREHLATAMSQGMKSPIEDALTSLEAPSPAASRQPLPQGEGTRAPQDYVPGEPALPVDGVITSPEGWRRDPIDGETRYHAGTDIAAAAGTPIRAVAGGRVVESGAKNGYGNTVVIETEDGRRMLYAHNLQNLVRVGDSVSAGDPIGRVGSTGRATGPHVHFEVKF